MSYVYLVLAALLTIAASPSPRILGQGRPAGHAPGPSLDSLRMRIVQRVSAHKDAVIGVAFHDFGSGDSLFLNADDSFHAASTMKVPVMIELFRRVDAGTLHLDQPVPLANQFTSIVDGSPFTLDPGADSDSAAYLLVGKRATVGELMDHMITRSSNLATNALVELVGAKTANATAHALGAKDMRVLRGVEDGKAFRAGMNNTTTLSRTACW